MRRQLCTLLVFPLLLVSAGGNVGEPAITVSDRPADRRVTVYEIVGQDGRLHLVRERVNVTATGAPAKDAVRGLLGHEPAADGHDSLWAGLCAPAAGVRSVQVGERLVTVRLRDFGPGEPGDATCDLTREGLRMQWQQVAWTVRTATGSRPPVRVVVGAGYHWMPPTRAHADALLGPQPDGAASAS